MGVDGAERVHKSCLDCQAEPEDRNIKKRGLQSLDVCPNKFIAGVWP